MRFVETAIAGRRRRGARAARRRARLVRAHVVPRRDRGRPVSTAELAQCSLSRNSPRRNAARAALPTGSARGGEARPLHARGDLRRRGRPSAGLADARRVVRRAARLRERPRPLRPGGLRPRLPDARRRQRRLYMISTPYAPEASPGVRWDDPCFGIAWPTPASGRSASATARCRATAARLSAGSTSRPTSSQRVRGVRGSPGTASPERRRRRRRLAPPSQRLNTQRSAASSLEPPAERSVEPAAPELRLAVRRRVDERLVPLEGVDDRERGVDESPSARGDEVEVVGGRVVLGECIGRCAREAPRTAGRSRASRTAARRRRTAPRSTSRRCGRAARPPRPGRPPRPRAGSACT